MHLLLFVVLLIFLALVGCFFVLDQPITAREVSLRSIVMTLKRLTKGSVVFFHNTPHRAEIGAC